MRRSPALRLALALLVAGTVAACDSDESAVIGPPEPSPLNDGFWYLHTANDSAPGGTIASRSVGIAPERTVLDSSWFFVNPYGEYEQRYWLRIFVQGQLDRNETVIDEGTWALVNNQYVFSSSVRTRSFVVYPTPDGRLLTEEPMVYWPDAPLVEGVYRRTRP